jgi:hypothetical protein
MPVWLIVTLTIVGYLVIGAALGNVTARIFAGPEYRRNPGDVDVVLPWTFTTLLWPAVLFIGVVYGVGWVLYTLSMPTYRREVRRVGENKWQERKDSITLARENNQLARENQQLHQRVEALAQLQEHEDLLGLPEKLRVTRSDVGYFMREIEQAGLTPSTQTPGWDE